MHTPPPPTHHVIKVVGTALGDDGRVLIGDALGLCAPPADAAAVRALVDSIQGVFFDLAEANANFK